MLGFDVKTDGGRDIVLFIEKSGRFATAGVARGMDRIGKAVVKRAFEYAPKSPTRTQVTHTLKVKRRSKRQCTPGGLERSIKHEVLKESGKHPAASVFIAQNAEAGKYAKRIHDEKGVTWWKRGPGTRAKGSKADEKFISRAIEDLRQYFAPILAQEIKRELDRA